MLTGVSWSSPDHTQGTDCLCHVYVFTVVVVVWDEGGGDTGWEGTISAHVLTSSDLIWPHKNCLWKCVCPVSTPHHQFQPAQPQAHTGDG